MFTRVVLAHAFRTFLMCLLAFTLIFCGGSIIALAAGMILCIAHNIDFSGEILNWMCKKEGVKDYANIRFYPFACNV